MGDLGRALHDRPDGSACRGCGPDRGVGRDRRGVQPLPPRLGDLPRERRTRRPPSRWARCSRRRCPSRCGRPSRPTAWSTRRSAAPFARSATTATSPTWSSTAPTRCPAPRPAPGWWRVGVGRRQRWCSRAAWRSTWAPPPRRWPPTASRPGRGGRPAGRGVLVSLGGDVAVAGPTPDEGWRIGVSATTTSAPREPDLTVTIAAGGLATSGTARRTWRRGGPHRAPHRRPAHGRRPRLPVAHGVGRRRHLRRRQHRQHGRRRHGTAAPGWLTEAPAARPARGGRRDGHLRSRGGRRESGAVVRQPVVRAAAPACCS